MILKQHQNELKNEELDRINKEAAVDPRPEKTFSIFFFTF